MSLWAKTGRGFIDYSHLNTQMNSVFDTSPKIRYSLPFQDIPSDEERQDVFFVLFLFTKTVSTHTHTFVGFSPLMAQEGILKKKYVVGCGRESKVTKRLPG